MIAPKSTAFTQMTVTSTCRRILILRCRSSRDPKRFPGCVCRDCLNMYLLAKRKRRKVSLTPKVDPNFKRTIITGSRLSIKTQGKNSSNSGSQCHRQTTATPCSTFRTFTRSINKTRKRQQSRKIFKKTETSLHLMQQLKMNTVGAPHLSHTKIKIQKNDGTQCRHLSIKAKTRAAITAASIMNVVQRSLVISKTDYLSTRSKVSKSYPTRKNLL